jgi:ABC-type amino acid transport substrate-binding protein
MTWAAGKTLTAEFGSTGDALARKWSRLVAGLKPASETDAATALQMVADGQADGALVDAVPAFDYLRTNPQLKVAGAIPESNAPYVMAVSVKSPVLLRNLTNALAALEADGRLGDLRAKWFGEAARIAP